MKELVKKIFEKAGFEIKKVKPKSVHEAMVTLRPKDGNKGNVLFSYIIEPFLLNDNEPLSNAHSHYFESRQIAQTFLDLGYSVDIISYRNTTYIPKKKYRIFVAARTNFQRIAQQLNHDCLKILHIDMAHWLYNNSAAYNRCIELQQKKKVSLKSYKMCEQNWAIEFADCATILGNQFTIDTYKYANKPIFRVPISSAVTYHWIEQKDFERSKYNYLWLGSRGLVHKGLDLVLDAFAEMPDYHLYICGPIDKEKDFADAYYRELYQTNNIHAIGWIDINGSEFKEILSKCIATIYPSCSEGGGGSVINCMHAGLIPIVSYQASVDVDPEFGLILKNNSILEIRESIQKISNLQSIDLKKMSRKAWEFARTKHSKESFAKEYRKIISEIITTFG